jgi:hypothetical protein
MGRRFSDVPREIGFSLEVKDSNVWVGQTVTVNHRDITDFTGLPIDTVFQLLSSKESKNFNYTGLEFTYGESLPEDEGGGDPDVDLVIIGGDIKDANLRTIYDSLFPAPGATTQAKFIVDDGVKVGATSVGTPGIDTGSWPAGAVVTLQTDIGAFVVGKGGNGGNGTPADPSEFPEDGGIALLLNYALTIVNNGVIGGGGGGGGGFDNLISPALFGGGGAGFDIGVSSPASQNGTLESGGISPWTFSGDGGDLGQDGEGGLLLPNPGIAGWAIDRNGFVLTETVPGDIRGFVLG